VTVPLEPASPDYACVVSRFHVVEPFDLPGLSRRRYLDEVMLTARALRDTTGATKINYEIHGNTIPHLHTHLYAKFTGEHPTTTRTALAGAILAAHDRGTPSSSGAHVPALYDAMADWFDEQTSTSFYNAHYDRPAVLDAAGDVNGLRIADLGCGPGVYLADLRERGADVVGVDGSAELLARARARVGPDVDLHHHDLEQPLRMFPDQSLDGVVSALVYHYIHNRIGVLSEIRRALRPGGWLVLSTSHPVADWLDAGGSYFAVEWTEAVFDRPAGRWTVPFWRMPLSVLVDEILSAGFVLERIIEPVPPADRESIDPRRYRRLRREPAFIVIRARRGA
jgi:SAM-dependent methyltransferase